MITYNHESYIAQAIESVLMQKTDFPFQLIIGDDCSIDRTREILAYYSEKYSPLVKVIYNNKNLGAQENSKNVFTNCSGQYIAMCEGDDFWNDKMKLQKQINLIRKIDYVLVHTDYNLLYQNSGKRIFNNNRAKLLVIPEGNAFNSLLSPYVPMIATSTVIFRNHLIDINRFYDFVRKKKWRLGDLALWLELSLKGKFGYIPESTATYRLLVESASRTNNNLKKHNFHLSVYDIRYYFLEKYSRDPDIKKTLDSAYYDVMIGDAFKMRDLEIARYALKIMKEKSIHITIKQKIKYTFLLLSYLFPSKK